MKRGEPLRRRTWIRSRSAKKTAEDAAYAEFRRERLERSPRCEACVRIAGSVSGVFLGHPRAATEIHHVKLRSRGGKNTHENTLAVCSICHRWIHDNPKAASEIGLMR